MSNANSIVPSPRSGDSEIPVDVCCSILRYIRDPTFLWTTCRVVSRTFRDAVDLTFAGQHLHRLQLSTNGGLFIDEEWGRHHHVDPIFKFVERDAANPDIAIFRDDTVDEEFRDELAQRLKRKFGGEFGNPCHAPRIMIELRAFVNDTPVSDMEADWDTLTIKANWPKMLTEFFDEQVAYNRALKKKTDAIKARIDGLRSSGEDPMDKMEEILNSFVAGSDAAREQVRTRRIKRHVWEQRQIKWTDSDKKGLRMLKELRKDLGWGEYSDVEEYALPPGEDAGDDSDEEDAEESDEDRETDEDSEDEVDTDDDADVDGGDTDSEEDDEDDADDEGGAVSEPDEREEREGPRTRRRQEDISPFPTRRRTPRRSKTPASLPPDQSEGPSLAPAAFTFSFKPIS